MRIALFTDSFLPYICGATFAALNQVNALAERGHQVRIYCPGPTPKQSKSSISDELHESVSVKMVPFSLPWGGQPNLNVVFPLLWLTMRDLRVFAPDVVHVHTEWGTGWAGIFAAWRLRIPTVGTFHTFWDDPLYVKHFPWPNWKIVQRAMGAYSALFYRRCDTVIAPSESVRSHLNQRDVNATVVSNGIPNPNWQSDEAIMQLKQKYGVKDRLTFLYLGRVSVEKTLHLCLEAFQRVNEAYPESRFVIIGDGPEMPRIKETISQLGLEDTVVLTGAVPHEELMLSNLPRIGDLFITASETENQPISILESMAFGLPAVGPRSRGIPELIDEGENGYLFDPGDVDDLAGHMTKIAESPEILVALSEGALQTGRGHSIARSAERLEIIYDARVKTPGRLKASQRNPAASEA